MASPFASFPRFVGDDKTQPVLVWLDMLIRIAQAQQPNPLTDAQQRNAFVTLCDIAAFTALAARGLDQPESMAALRANLAKVFCVPTDPTLAETAFASLRQAPDQPILTFAREFSVLNKRRAGNPALPNQVGVFRNAILPTWRSAIETQRNLTFDEIVDIISILEETRRLAPVAAPATAPAAPALAAAIHRPAAHRKPGNRACWKCGVAGHHSKHCKVADDKALPTWPGPPNAK
jgi:hypothetical protein